MKGEVGVEISALLAFAAVNNNDRVGLLIFTDGVEVFVPPEKGRKHVLRVIRELLYFEPKGARTDVAGALDHLDKVLHRRSIVFLISDFIDKEFSRAIQQVRRRHDLVAVSLCDPRERELPDVGFINLEDAETGEQIVIDTKVLRIREEFRKMQMESEQDLSKLFRRLDVDHVSIDVTKPYVEPLVALFSDRARRR